MCVNIQKDIHSAGINRLEQANTIIRALVILSDAITNEPTEDSCFVMRELLKIALSQQNEALEWLQP